MLCRRSWKRKTNLSLPLTWSHLLQPLPSQNSGRHPSARRRKRRLIQRTTRLPQPQKLYKKISLAQLLSQMKMNSNLQHRKLHQKMTSARIAPQLHLRRRRKVNLWSKRAQRTILYVLRRRIRTTRRKQKPSHQLPKIRTNKEKARILLLRQQ